MSMNAYKAHVNHHIRQSMIRRVNVLLVQLSKCYRLTIPSLMMDCFSILILRKWMRRWEQAIGNRVKCRHTIIERDELSMFICGERMVMAILMAMVMVDIFYLLSVEHLIGKSAMNWLLILIHQNAVRDFIVCRLVMMKD